MDPEKDILGWVSSDQIRGGQPCMWGLLGSPQWVRGEPGLAAPCRDCRAAGLHRGCELSKLKATAGLEEEGPGAGQSYTLLQTLSLFPLD